MLKEFHQEKMLKRKVESLQAKLDASTIECSERGKELTRINDLVQSIPMPESTRKLLREPLTSYVDRCGKGKG